MAKMKVKFDMSSVKQFLFEKGEKVGLIACTLIMALVVAYALYSGFNARGTDKGEPWDKAIVDASKRVEIAMSSAAPTEDANKKPFNPRNSDWDDVRFLYHFLPLFPMPDKGGKKRTNPFTLPIVSGQDDKLFQMNYYQCGTFQWDIDPVAKKVTVLVGGGDGKAAGGMVGPGGVQGNTAVGQPQAGAAAGNLAKSVRPSRFVVVSAIFPMRDQLEEFRQKLNYNSIEELLANRADLPRPIGLEVARCEILPGGKATPWSPFLSFDKNGKVVIEPTLRSMMQRMIVDEEEQQAAAQYIFPGLVTPLPKIANPGTRYAKVELKDFDVKQPVLADAGAQAPGIGMVGNKPGNQFAPMMPNFGKGKGNPMGEAGADAGAGAQSGPEMQLRREPWSKAPKELQLKFLEKYDIFDPLGHSASQSGADKKGGAIGGGMGSSIVMGGGSAGGMGGNTSTGVWGWDLHLSGAGAGGVPGAGPMKGDDMADEGTGAKPGAAAAPSVAVNLNGALVRFFDPSVEPGKTYCYTIRVKLANPNHKKPNDVAYLALSEQKELQPMPSASQGWVATPAITIPYDYHWYAVDQAPEVKINKGADYKNPPFGVETVPIQVHRWVEKTIDANGEYTSADWAIAERLHQRRGESIGRQRVMIELPIWRLTMQAWQIGDSVQAAVGKRKPAGAGKADPIDAGIPIDLVTAPPTIIVDFDGGKKGSFEKRDGSREYINDTSAVDVLALTPSGKLVLRNSRIDSDPEIPASVREIAVGAERKDRYDLWRQRLAELRAGHGAAAAAPAMPGGAKPGGGR